MSVVIETGIKPSMLDVATVAGFQKSLLLPANTLTEVSGIKSSISTINSSISTLTTNTNLALEKTEVVLTADDTDLLTKLNSYKNAKVFTLAEGTYKMQAMFYNNTERMITIKGSGIDKTILINWDFVNGIEKVDGFPDNFSNIRYENLTIRNMSFGQYGGANIDHSGRRFELVNVKHEYTLYKGGAYCCYAITKNLDILLKNYTLVCSPDYPIYNGICFSGAVNATLENVYVGDDFTKPFLCDSAGNIRLTRVHTKGGKTGIFFGAGKDRPLDNFIVENCIIEGATEESLSFDTYGNNVAANPCIAELSVTSASIIDVEYDNFINKQLKIYCASRIIVGQHPNETYQAYTFEGHETYLEQFYIYFSSSAGATFEGKICKILEVGIDEVGEYVIVNTNIDPAGLTLNEYKAVSIMSGFFNGVIRNNIIRAGKNTGIAMYMSFFNNVVEGNKVENCTIGSYLNAGVMLAPGVWNGACGNKIINNTFEGKFTFGKYSTIKGYNNVFVNNSVGEIVGEETEENLLNANNQII